MEKLIKINVLVDVNTGIEYEVKVELYESSIYKISSQDICYFIDVRSEVIEIGVILIQLLDENKKHIKGNYVIKEMAASKGLHVMKMINPYNEENILNLFSK